MLKGGASLLGRATGHGGGVYFCATTPAPTDSSLAANGVVLYAMVQRALAAGSSTLGTTRQLVAGDASAEPGVRVGDWRRLAGRSEAISTEFAFHPGVYQAGDKLFAVNRAEGEDRSPVLADQRVSALFRGLDFARVDDRAGSIASLIDEIWRPFLGAMIAFLILEAVLCLPRNQAIEGARGAGTP